MNFAIIFSSLFWCVRTFVVGILHMYNCTKARGQLYSRIYSRTHSLLSWSGNNDIEANSKENSHLAILISFGVRREHSAHTIKLCAINWILFESKNNKIYRFGRAFDQLIRVTKHNRRHTLFVNCHSAILWLLLYIYLRSSLRWWLHNTHCEWVGFN